MSYMKKVPKSSKKCVLLYGEVMHLEINRYGRIRMTLLSDYEAQFCARFDSWSKKVLSSRAKNILTRRPKHKKHEILVEDPTIFHDNSVLPLADPNEYVVTVGVLQGGMRSYELYMALTAVKRKQLIVVLLQHWHNWSDEEIAEHMNITTRAVRKLRTRAYSQIQKHYKRRTLCITCSTTEPYRPP